MLGQIKSDIFKRKLQTLEAFLKLECVANRHFIKGRTNDRHNPMSTLCAVCNGVYGFMSKHSAPLSHNARGMIALMMES